MTKEPGDSNTQNDKNTEKSNSRKQIKEEDIQNKKEKIYGRE